MKDQILKLRIEGKTYTEICKTLGCSKSIVSYWCNERVKTKAKIKTNQRKQNKQWRVKLEKAISQFKSRTRSINFRTISSQSWEIKFRLKIHEYKRRMKDNKGFTATTILKSIEDPTKVKCYLTGRNIDLTKDDYHLDHIIPISKGGSCTLDNLGFTCPEANWSKSNLTLEEYLSLCKEVLENFGYKIIKE